MVAQKDGPFVNLARLNLEKYGSDKSINRYLFEYAFFHEGDIKISHQVVILILFKIFVLKLIINSKPSAINNIELISPTATTKAKSWLINIKYRETNSIINKYYN